jgi:hypothetical protein
VIYVAAYHRNKLALYIYIYIYIQNENNDWRRVRQGNVDGREWLRKWKEMAWWGCGWNVGRGRWC